MKRGQMEMIGLVVIVILITLGMLFMATFAFKKDPKKKIFVRKGLAYGTMGALMKTNVECEVPPGSTPYEEQPTIGMDLIEDCAVNHGSYLHYSKFRCNGQHTCDFLDGLISDLLNKTLGKWNKHYEFSSKLLGEEEPLIEIKDNRSGKEIGCLRRPVDVDSSEPFPIPTDAGLVENILYLCD